MTVDPEPGDEYVRRTAAFIRANEQGLAQGAFRRKRVKQPSAADAPSALNPLNWFAPATNGAASTGPKPVTFTADIHRLFYLFIRLEALNIDVGSLDVRVTNPSRPLSYIDVVPSEKKSASDAVSLSSFRSSFSAISKLSLGPSSWWGGRSAPQSIDAELKYLYSCFTILPSLSLHAPGPKVIAEMAEDPPNENALPLYAFKCLQALECVDVDPRALMGWDQLSVSLLSLTVKRSGLEDIGDLFISAVLDDKARREDSARRTAHRRIGSTSVSFYASRLPDTVAEQDEPEHEAATPTEKEQPQEPKLPSLAWSSLRYLSLSDNALTFVPSPPLTYLTSVTHIDLSSNLLVSIPSGLSALHNLHHLNLSDNMIDSVLGIYTNIGGILSLDLSRNRLESLCGLERLMALERVDIRHNQVEESAEVGRLATLPNIREVFVEGNPLTELEESYRVRCFNYFWVEGKQIVLDGTPANMYEKRYMTTLPSQQMTSSRPVSAAYSPPIVAVSSPPPRGKSLMLSPSPSGTQSPPAGPQRGRRKKNKRIVDLNGDLDGDSNTGTSPSQSRAQSHRRMMSGDSIPSKPHLQSELPSPKARSPRLKASSKPPSSGARTPSPKPPTPDVAQPEPSSSKASPALAPVSRSRHSRYQTEHAPLSPTSPGLPTADSLGSSPSASNSPVVPVTKAGTLGRSAKRRARASVSVWEGGANDKDAGTAVDPVREADAYRARLEALRSDMGEGWLKVFSRSQMTPKSQMETAQQDFIAAHPP